MSELTFVVAISIPLMGALFALVLFTRYQQRTLLRRQQAELIRLKADTLLDAFNFLVKVDNEKELQHTVIDRLDYLYGCYYKTLPPKDAVNMDTIFNRDVCQNMVESIAGDIRVLKCDREIQFAKRQFSTILRGLTPMIKQGVLATGTLEEYRRYLTMILLEREVDTLIAYGETSAQSGDISGASEYFKTARTKTYKFDSRYPKKEERLNIIQEHLDKLYAGDRMRDAELAKELADAKAKNDEQYIDPFVKRKY